MNADAFLAAVKGRLIVSCQALEDEPLHGATDHGANGGRG